MNVNQLIHITGYDDYQMSQIEILKNPYKIKHKSKKKQGADDQQKKQGSAMQEEGPVAQELNLDSDVILSQVEDPAKQESLQSLAHSKKLEGKETDVNNLLNAIEEMDIGNDKDNEEEQKQQQSKKGKSDIQDEMVVENEENNDEPYEDQLSDVSYDEAKDQQVDQNDQKKKQDEMVSRNADELEFEDEVDYPPTTLLRDRYQKYQGMKSFKNDDWDPYKNLPEEFEYIYTLKNIANIRKVALKSALTEAFAYAGMYIRIYLKNFPIEKLNAHNQEFPIIISSLLKHERKTTLMHFKVNLSDDFKECASKKSYDVHLGFRKFNTSLIFSRIYPNNKKTKYVKVVKNTNGQPILASLYYYCTYAPCPVLVFDSEASKNAGKYILSGQLVQSDQSDVILKRIILSGYPYKINKRKAVVKYLFFNPKDVSYFSPIDVHTKLGLRGRILESVGTHGLCKIMFNQPIKQHDTIMIQLYKRVYPKNLILNKLNL